MYTKIPWFVKSGGTPDKNGAASRQGNAIDFVRQLKALISNAVEDNQDYYDELLGNVFQYICTFAKINRVAYIGVDTRICCPYDLILVEISQILNCSTADVSWLNHTKPVQLIPTECAVEETPRYHPDKNNLDIPTIIRKGHQSFP